MTLRQVAMRDIARRFAPTGDAAGNEQILNDPDAIGKVPPDILEEVDYPRPPFNWPSPDIPQANYFVIEAMALDVLRKAGYSREARSLRARLEFMPPSYDDFPGILHRLLDFDPPPPLPRAKLAELLDLAEQMGLDPGSMARARKKPQPNPLAHPRRSDLDEWAWLVENAGVESPFGKTAACELSGECIAKLAALWLPTLGEPPARPPEDSRWASRPWFDERFPMGWLHVDRLGESACASAPMLNFEDRVTLMVYEIESKAERGWPIEDCRRIGYDHKSSLDVSGSAAIAMEAMDFLSQRFDKALLEGSDLSGAGEEPSPLRAHLSRSNPEAAMISNDLAVWLGYRLADPCACAEVERAWLSSKRPSAKEGSTSSGRAAALAEKLALLLPSAPVPFSAAAARHAQAPARNPTTLRI